MKKTDDLAPTFTRVAQELHSQYTLGFTPTVLDGKEHKLDGEDEASRDDRPRAQVLHRLSRSAAAEHTQVTEQEFRLEADRALEELQRALMPLADEHDFESRAAERRAAGGLRGPARPSS